MDGHDETPPTPEDEEQAERGAALLAAALADPGTLAPPALREAIERERARAAEREGRRAAGRRGLRDRRPVVGPDGRARHGDRARPLAALAAGLAVAAVALVIALGGGDAGPERPTVAHVTAVARRPATDAAPRALPGAGPPRVAAAVEGVAFPDWTSLAWPASGRRDDTIHGRAVTTVYYRSPRGATLGYAIVAGPPLTGLPPGRDVRVGPTTYRLARAGGRTTVVWTQGGHTCVIDSPSSVPDDRLLALASYADA